MRALLAVAMLLSAACQKREPAPAPAAPPPPAAEPRREGGFKPIGAVEGENRGYDDIIEPPRVIAALKLTPGMRVADVGAGRGYFVLRLSDAVGPSGSVVATDVDEDAIAALKARTAQRPNVSVRRVEPNDPGLEAGGYDLVLMSQVDHFLEDRVAYLRKLATTLRPGGRIAVTHTHALKAPLAEAAETAGLTVVGGEDGKAYYLLLFQPR